MSISPAIVRQLITLGEIGSAETGDAQRLLDRLRPHDQINRLHWSSWNAICNELSIDMVERLVRGLTIAEQFHNWIGGSAAAVIWTFRYLNERDSGRAAQLADWVLERTTNPYAPFGSMNHGARSLAQYRLASEIRQKRIASGLEETEQAESRAEDFRRRRQAQKQRAHADRRTPARAAFLESLARLPLRQQYEHLAADETYPVEFYPTRLAYALSPELLSAMDKGFRLQLLERVKGKRKGPWGAFKRRIRRTFVDEMGNYGMPWDRKGWFR